VEKIFRALASKHRRSVLDALYERAGQSLSELCEHRQMTRQAVSRHLAVLESAGLVVARWEGREKLHYLNPVPLRQLHDRWLRKFDGPAADVLLELKRSLEHRPRLHR
jgi:DNA-binding transcriptional ArsR family regulator